MRYFGVRNTWIKRLLLKKGRYKIKKERVDALVYDCKRHLELLKMHEESKDLFKSQYNIRINKSNSNKPLLKIEKFLDFYEKIKESKDEKAPITITSNGIRLDGSHRASILKFLGVKNTEVKVIYAPRFLLWLIGREVIKKRRIYDKFEGRRVYINKEFKGRVLYTDFITKKSSNVFGDYFHFLDTGEIIRTKKCYLKKVDKELLETKIRSLGNWDYYIDFGRVKVRSDLKKDKTSGLNNWNNYLKYCLPDIKDKRILDIGCKSGLYDLEIAKMDAAEVIGIDSDVNQALFVKNFFSKRWREDFSNATFIQRDIKEGLRDLGKFDFVCLFQEIEDFQANINFIMEEISNISERVVLQNKYASKDAIKDLLRKHGFEKIHIFELGDYPKPVVIGEK